VSKNITSSKTNNLHVVSQFALFVTSYLPLFFLLILKQVSSNIEYLKWGGIHGDTITTISKFGFTLILVIVSILGWIGYLITFSNLDEEAENGQPVYIKDLRNKNSEAIGYIATYIIPFLYQSFEGWYECISVFFLLAVIYRIYINSNLLLINPILSMWFTIYDIEFEEGNSIRNGLIVSKDKTLMEDERVKLYPIGHKLYYAIRST